MKDKGQNMKIKVYNSGEKLVFFGTLEEFKKFTKNDSDRIEIIND